MVTQHLAKQAGIWKLKKWNQELIVENNNLTNKQKAKIVSVKKQAEPSYTPKAIDHNKVTNKIENKNMNM